MTTSDVIQREWAPLSGSLPSSPEADKVYVLPTRYRAGDDEQNSPLYTDMVRYVPKDARAAGIPVEFSLPSNARNYLSEYAIDPITASIAIACVQVISDWVILAVEIFRENRARAAGLTTEQSSSMPLRVSIAKLDPSSGAVEGVELEGPGDAVLEALKDLRTNDG